MSKPNNPPAFPRAYSLDDHNGSARMIDGDAPMHAQDGMTLRDYFAAKAMQAMLANPYTGEKFHKENATKEQQQSAITTNAYEVASAMLEERAKQ